MTEKHNWITDDLCLIEETTGVKLYGTVCTDMTFIAEQLNDANKSIIVLEKENKELKATISELEDYNEKLFEDKTKWQIKLQKIRDYAMEDGEVKQGVIEKVVFE